MAQWVAPTEGSSLVEVMVIGMLGVLLLHSEHSLGHVCGGTALLEFLCGFGRFLANHGPPLSSVPGVAPA